MTNKEKLNILLKSGEYDFLNDIPENTLWKLFFAANFINGEPDNDEARCVEQGETINKVLAILGDYDLYKQDEDGDLVACKAEVMAEVKALEDKTE